jgi:glycosyltransferase involved in cell wall biosynthesis
VSDNLDYQVEVSAIIPTLNKQETIGVCIQKVRQVFEKYGIRGEIIVSDSSKDQTPEVACTLAAIVVKPDRRGGYGYAYRFAFKYAKGKHIVSLYNVRFAINEKNPAIFFIMLTLGFYF